MHLIGPFSQVLTLENTQAKGALFDDDLVIKENAGVLIDQGKIFAIDDFENLKNRAETIEDILQPQVLLPGFIDSHTHICFAGSRAKDYAMRVAGKSYLEIAKEGGGILDTVRQTREATSDDLAKRLRENCDTQLRNGITTSEVKSGYGLTVADEIKMLKVIQEISKTHQSDLVSSCLAAHVMPPEFSEHKAYLDFLLKELLPQVKDLGLSQRVDIFVEDGAFTTELAENYLQEAKKLGFAVIVHADQFSSGGAELAVKVGAVSADHLEASDDRAMTALAKSDVVATVLPGASLGLGMPFAPARKLLDRGSSVAIASDWNPGSAPMGDLLTQACVLGAEQKLTLAETLAGITCRSANALSLFDRGTLAKDFLADMVSFPTNDYREIFYHQGRLKACGVWKKGESVNLS